MITLRRLEREGALPSPTRLPLVPTGTAPAPACVPVSLRLLRRRPFRILLNNSIPAKSDTLRCQGAQKDFLRMRAARATLYVPKIVSERRLLLVVIATSAVTNLTPPRRSVQVITEPLID